MQKAKIQKLFYILIFIFSALASAKLIFVGFCHDEEYQVVMAYRQATGDTLFGTMWEPHQTSAFINAFLIFLYTKLFGTTTGIIVFLRTIGCLLHAGMSFLVYKTLLKFNSLKEDPFCVFLIASMYYNTTVSLFAEAEYSNMLYWSSTLVVIFLCRFLQNNAKEQASTQKILDIAGAALSLCFMVLSFPPMILFSVFVLAFVVLLSDKQDRIKNAVFFTLTAIIFGLLYSLIQIAQVGFSTFIATIPKIVTNDNTHELSDNSYWTDKFPAAIHSIGPGLIIFLGIIAVAVAAGVITFKAKNKSKTCDRLCAESVTITVAGALSILVTLFFWICKGKGFESSQIFILIGLAGATYFGIVYCKGKEKLLVSFILIMGLFNLIVGYMFSNMELEVKLPHLVYIIVVWMLLYMKRSHNTAEKAVKRLMYVNLILWIAFFVFAKGFMLRSGSEKNNILSTNNICRSGPAIGILSDYMHTFIMDKNYEEWDNYVEEGDTVLIVSKTLHSDVITSYLFKDVNIAHYAVNNPYSYTDTLLTYWELYPEKKPNVIIIDCWFGQPLIEEDEWIMQYIENEMGYTSISDGDYLRYYRKNN